MPDPPETGPVNGVSARTSENTRTLRSHFKQAKSYQTEFPALQGTDEPQNPPPVKPSGEKVLTSATGTPKAKPAKPPPALQKIAKMIEQIISKHNPPGQVKQALTEVVEVAKKAAEEEKGVGLHVPLNAVKTLHERFKADLLVVQDSLDAKISDIQTSQKKMLSSTESLRKSTESLHSATKELEGKVTKVNDTTDRIANTTTSYRDALTAKPTSPFSPGADPKVLNDRDRRARQLLIGYSSVEDNATLNVSLLDLKEKANRITTEMEDPTRPEVVKIENVTRTRNGSLLLLLNSKEAADWLREPDTEDRFLDKFAIGACIRDRSYDVMLRWVPITFDPDNYVHRREVEEANTLPDHSIQKARWIKPINRRRTGQTRAHAVLSLTNVDVANRIIKEGLDICGARTRAEKTKQGPLQCLKCRGWEHKAQDCKAQTDTCGTCGDNHRTNACKNKDKLFCASCKTDAHASWDRSCPEFKRRCAIYDDRYPENNIVFFPTEQDWTLTTRPSRIPTEERFPQHHAVKSLPSTNRKSTKPVVRLPPNRNPGSKDSPQAQSRQRPEQQQQGEVDPVSRILNRTQPNLVPLGRGREEGELSDPADNDSSLEQSDTLLVEQTLDWSAEPPSMAGGWFDQPTGW